MYGIGGIYIFFNTNPGNYFVKLNINQLWSTRLHNLDGLCIHYGFLSPTINSWHVGTELS